VLLLKDKKQFWPAVAEKLDSTLGVECCQMVVIKFPQLWAKFPPPPKKKQITSIKTI
jgi:hypothetical protein